MAKQAAAPEQNPGLVARVRIFIEEVQAEMKKVTWPTAEDLKVSTKVTMYMLLIMATIIFFYDQVFQYIVVKLLDLLG